MYNCWLLIAATIMVRCTVGTLGVIESCHLLLQINLSAQTNCHAVPAAGEEGLL